MNKLSVLAIGALLAWVQPAQASGVIPVPEPGAFGLFALGTAATVLAVRYIRRR